MATPTTNPPAGAGARRDEPPLAPLPAEPRSTVAPAESPQPAGPVATEAERHPAEALNGSAATGSTAVAPTAAPTVGADAAPASPAAQRAAPQASRHSAPAHADLPHRECPRGRRKRFWLLLPILVIALVVGLILGYRYWYQNTYFVWTENASVTGDLVQVGSLNAGRIVATRVDVGRPVRTGQEIAVVAMPREIGSSAIGATPRMGITGSTDELVPVYSPLDGIVAARMGHVGGTVTAGQPIYSLVDPRQVWIRANIEESLAWRVQVGQEAEIHVDALNRDFVGHVDAITPASAATFSLLPANNASGNFTKVTQYVPVKIVVEVRGVVLPLGTSVEVLIKVREPGEAFPLPWQP